MKLDLRPLRAERGGTIAVNLHEAVASGLDDVRFLRPVDGNLTLANLGPALRVDCDLTTVAELTCDRCARVFHHALKAAIHDDFDWVTDAEGFLTVDGDLVTVDVDAMARDALVLELPMVTQCDPACKGLCDQCGADLRIEPCRCAQRASDVSEPGMTDPRLSPLAGWRRGGDAGRR